MVVVGVSSGGGDRNVSGGWGGGEENSNLYSESTLTPLYVATSRDQAINNVTGSTWRRFQI